MGFKCKPTDIEGFFEKTKSWAFINIRNETTIRNVISEDLCGVQANWDIEDIKVFSKYFSNKYRLIVACKRNSSKKDKNNKFLLKFDIDGNIEILNAANEHCKLKESHFGLDGTFEDLFNSLLPHLDWWKDIKNGIVEVPKGVSSLWEFAYCNLLESIDFGAEVWDIESHAFYKCVNLKELKGNLKGVQRVQEYAFAGCVKLKEIPLNIFSMEEIGKSAFNSCKSLKEFSLGYDIREIKSWAFNNCTKLEKIVFNQGNRLKTIEGYAFRNCKSLNEVVYKGSYKDWLKYPLPLENSVLLNCKINCTDGDITYKNITDNWDINIHLK